jgi:hypothetical protein
MEGTINTHRDSGKGRNIMIGKYTDHDIGATVIISLEIDRPAVYFPVAEA